MTTTHATVWLDHRTARILTSLRPHPTAARVEDLRTRRQVHRKSGIPGSGKAEADHAFFDEIISAVAGSDEVLVVGPGFAKVQFHSYVAEHRPDLADRLVGVETVDHPSDGELLSYARRYFQRVDQLRAAR